MPVDFGASSTPALAEVAMSVGFEELHRMLRYELDALHETKYAKSFPNDEEKAPHKPSIEQPDGELAPLPSAAELTNIRRWFSDEPGTHLIQVQRNWFARNWRVTERGAAEPGPLPYPGYTAVRSNFLDSLRRFIDYVQEAGLGRFRPLQCEITYRFHLQAGEVWNGPAELDRAVRIFSGRRDGRLPDLEAMRIITQYAMADDDGARLGRLYGRLETARSEDGADYLILTMFSRGIPGGDSPEEVCGFLDAAQEWIVDGTRDFLTPEAVESYRLA